MRTVYLAHPLLGDIDKNYESISAIARRLARSDDGICPISPIHAFAFLPATDAECDQNARRLCRHLVSLTDEMRVYGDWQSSAGCRMEVEIAQELGIPVYFEEGHAGGAA